MQIFFISLQYNVYWLGIHIFFDLIDVGLQLPFWILIVHCPLNEPPNAAVFDAEIYLPQIGINLLESDVCLSQLLDDVQIIRAHLNIIV